MTPDERTVYEGAVVSRAYEAVILAADTIWFLGMLVGFAWYGVQSIGPSSWSFMKVTVAMVAAFLVGIYMIRRARLSFLLLDHFEETAADLEPLSERSPLRSTPVRLFSSPIMAAARESFFLEETHAQLFFIAQYVHLGIMVLCLLNVIWQIFSPSVQLYLRLTH